ncbi:hypothetical protein D3C87_1465600 [compost metagenome]
MQSHRVIALSQWIQEFVNRNGNARFIALGKIIALKHSSHCVLCRHTDKIRRSHFVDPRRIVNDLRFFWIEDFINLFRVGFTVFFDLFARQNRTSRVFARWIPDLRREIPDQKENLVSQVLESAQFIDHHGVADMNIRTRRIRTQFDIQRLTSGLTALKFFQHLFIIDELCYTKLNSF